MVITQSMKFQKFNSDVRYFQKFHNLKILNQQGKNKFNVEIRLGRESLVIIAIWVIMNLLFNIGLE